MPSAAGIILATGAMTLGNDFLQSQNPPDPKAPVASQVNFRVIPATVLAAGIFYVFEQANASIAKTLAWIIFATAFAFPAEHHGFYVNPDGSLNGMKLSPLQSLLNITQGPVKPGQYGE